jgi:hypothetical protein
VASTWPTLRARLHLRDHTSHRPPLVQTGLATPISTLQTAGILHPYGRKLLSLKPDAFERFSMMATWPITNVDDWCGEFAASSPS